ncbi:hypothetical protein B296_00032690 [Ensete ventricosum]|uniref:Uncharacterized protein n=1 Tax=Ensete ventricosum TaxID=4639 RepID=A0A427ACX0_ENSVE|nr:hypothetical protein B296_00032690 [Ensete ventricosum]
MGGWRFVKHYSNDVAHVRQTRLRRYKWSFVILHCGTTTTFGARGRAHVARLPFQSLSQSDDRGSSSSYPNRRNHASYHGRTLGPPPGLTDGGQSTLTPDRYWRLLIDPRLTPPGHTAPQTVTAEAFLKLAHQVQALTGMIQAIIPHIPQLAQTTAPPQSEPQWPPANQGGSQEHSAAARPGLTEQNSPKTQSETPSIVPEKSIAPHLGEEHTPREPDTLSSDSTNSF